MRCYSCQSDLPVDDFAPDRSKATGRKSICRPCDRAKSRAYYARNRQAVIARVRAQQGRPA